MGSETRCPPFQSGREGTVFSFQRFLPPTNCALLPPRGKNYSMRSKSTQCLRQIQHYFRFPISIRPVSCWWRREIHCITHSARHWLQNIEVRCTLPTSSIRACKNTRPCTQKSTLRRFPKASLVSFFCRGGKVLGLR